MTWRTLAALGAALAVVVAVVAVLAPNHGSAIDPVAQAADTTASAGSAEFGMAGTMTIAGQTIPIKASGTTEMQRPAMHMTMSLPIPGAGQTDIEEIFDGTTMYMRFPSQFTQRIPGGKTWMKLDLQTLGKSSGVDFKQLMQTSQNNPADMLKALKAIGTTHVVGQEGVDGAPTTHYAGTIDFNKVADRGRDAANASALKQLFKTNGISSMPVDVWIDRSGRVRREGMKLSTSAFAMDITIDFTRFGVPVDTTAPPSDQVMDASALLGSANP
jgi:hypothetical protein